MLLGRPIGYLEIWAMTTCCAAKTTSTSKLGNAFFPPANVDEDAECYAAELLVITHPSEGDLAG